jgi:putative tryptophan/tyrosine transport system substrate-binding protein
MIERRSTRTMACSRRPKADRILCDAVISSTLRARIDSLATSSGMRRLMTSRVTVILLLCLFAIDSALAQSTAELPLVGVLRLDTPESVKPVATIFRNRLASLGQVDGRNIRIDFRLASGHAERFPELAHQLVRDKASVIVASGDAAVRAAQQATKTIPIVAVVDDIVAAGLIDSLAKPGGNTTGVSILATELDAKRLDILKRIVGSGHRFAVLSDPSSAQAQPQLLIDTAKTLGVELITEEVRSPENFAAAFDAFRAKGAEAIIMRSSPLLFGFRKDLCSLSMTHRLLSITQNREQAEAGCVISYGVKLSEMHGLAAEYTDKMLRGALPRETPAQQPASYELIINQKSAKALGIELPTSLLTEADEVIE